MLIRQEVLGHRAFRIARVRDLRTIRLMEDGRVVLFLKFPAEKISRDRLKMLGAYWLRTGAIPRFPRQDEEE